MPVTGPSRSGSSARVAPLRHRASSAARTNPKLAREIQNATRGDESVLQNSIDRFSKSAENSVFMEYDIQLFDLNREQYRKTRIAMFVTVAFVVLYGIFAVVAEPLCTFIAHKNNVGGDDPCVIDGPMSCYTTVCEDEGLTCHFNGECLCPGHATTCNMTNFAAHNHTCHNDNYRFADSFHGCGLVDGLLFANLCLQVVTLGALSTFTALYCHQIRTYEAPVAREEADFFTRKQKLVAVLAVLTCIGKLACLVYTGLYARSGWFMADARHSEHGEEHGEESEVDTAILEASSSLIEKIVQTLVAATALFVPIILFIGVLAKLPFLQWDIKCQTVLSIINVTVYTAARIGFGYAFGQSFGFVPFTYWLSIAQVCTEDTPDAILAEAKAALVLANLETNWSQWRGVHSFAGTCGFILAQCCPINARGYSWT